MDAQAIAACCDLLSEFLSLTYSQQPRLSYTSALLVVICFQNFYL